MNYSSEVTCVRWENDHAEPVTHEAMAANGDRVIEFVDCRGRVVDRFRPRNLGGGMLRSQGERHE